MNLNNKSLQWKSALIVFYDLEFSGNIRNNFGENCSIHEIAAQSKSERFYCKINPYLTKHVVEPPVDTKYHMPSKEEFQRIHALPFPIAYQNFVAFIFQLLQKRRKKWVCLISHNGFRSDKIVLEHEVAYHNLPQMPFFYFDSLLYLREVQPGLSSYSLQNIYKEIFGTAYEAHNAFVDTKALLSIFKKIKTPLHGVVYPTNTIPWRNVVGIGYHTEQSFLQCGFVDLTALFRASAGNENITRQILYDRGIVLTENTLKNIFHWYKLAYIVIQRQHATCILDAPCPSPAPLPAC